MAPTKKEVEKGIERFALWFEKTLGRPFSWINQVQDFNNSLKKSTSYWSEEMKYLLKERNRSRQLYLLERELILVENRIREMREKAKESI